MRVATRTWTDSAPPRALGASPPEKLMLRAGPMRTTPRTPTPPTPKANKTLLALSFLSSGGGKALRVASSFVLRRARLAKKNQTNRALFSFLESKESRICSVGKREREESFFFFFFFSLLLTPRTKSLPSFFFSTACFRVFRSTSNHGTASLSWWRSLALRTSRRFRWRWVFSRLGARGERGRSKRRMRGRSLIEKKIVAQSSSLPSPP